MEFIELSWLRFFISYFFVEVKFLKKHKTKIPRYGNFFWIKISRTLFIKKFMIRFNSTFKKILKKMFWNQRKILPAITTLIGSEWQKKVEDVKNLGLKEVCFFATGLDAKEREKFYEMIKGIKILKIPFVHLRTDMKLEELDYLVENYGTQFFNLHSLAEYPLAYDYSKYRDIIYIENSSVLYKEEELDKFSGICFDFAHIENDRIWGSKDYKKNLEMLAKYKIGCNHISVIKKTPEKDSNGQMCYDSHLLEDFSELDYLKNYPAEFFGSVMAIELQNSIKDQLEAKEYIVKLLGDKK